MTDLLALILTAFLALIALEVYLVAVLAIEYRDVCHASRERDDDC